MTDTPKRSTRDPALIARLCEAVYRRGLYRNGERMVEDDGDDGAKLRRRAMAYAPIIGATLDALDAEPVEVTPAMLDAALAAPVLTFLDWPDRLADLPRENLRRMLTAALAARRTAA